MNSVKVFNDPILSKNAYKSDRPFDKQNHQLVDKISKQKTIEYFTTDKYLVVENEFEHGIDLVIISKQSNEIIGYLEVSTCKNLEKVRKNNQFKVPLRKSKFFKNTIKPTKLIVWNADYTMFAIVKSENIISSPEITLTDNGFVDKFYKVDEKYIQYFPVEFLKRKPSND